MILYQTKLILFFYFANQFVYRGYQINLIGAIALTYGRACDFRGNEINYYLLPVCNSYYHSFHNDISVNKSKRNQRLAYYIELLNSFDPFVNKVVHYYIRSIFLLEDGYDEEALTAADNAIDIIFQVIKQQKKLPSKSREDMYTVVSTEIVLPHGTIKQLERLYILRCEFTAHPAHSKWWDFYEIYEDEITSIMYAVKETIIKYLIYEKNNRTIEKFPACWSKWFIDNCDTIYDAVWFHKLPKING